MKAGIIRSRVLMIALVIALAVAMVSAASEAFAADRGLGYIPIDIEISEADDSSSDDGEFSLVKGALPEEYSSPDQSWYPEYIKDKNQGTYGICYAFAATTAAEISYSKETGKACTQTSPGHLAWYGYNTTTDPMGLTTGDGITLKSGTAWTLGGNSFYTMMSVARGIGMAQFNATSNPLLPSSSSYTYSSTGAYDCTALSAENIEYIIKSDKTDDQYINEIKEEVYEHGAVDTSMYWESSSYTSSSRSYCYTGSEKSNHGVVIVGWDDDYSTGASEKGAWLVQNSWGADGGGRNFDRGTFYVSYYDTVLLSEGAFIWDMCAGDTYNQRYQYDGGVAEASVPLTEGYWAANTYTVPADTNLSLEAVSFTVLTEGTAEYDIKIFRNGTSPVNGTLAASLTGVTTEHAGYHTYELDSPVLLSGGESYSIVIYPKGDVLMACDMAGSDEYFDFLSVTEEGQSFYGVGYGCADANDSGACFRIKGLGNKFTAVDLSKASVSIAAQTYTGSAITPEVNIDGLEAGKDFTVKYSNNVNAGTATAVITPKTIKCTGSKTVTFKINAADISKASITQTDFTYPDSVNPKVTFNGKTLTEGTDYETMLACIDSLSNRSYVNFTLTITGKGNFTGTKSVEVKMYKADINSTEISLEATEFIYQGSDIKPEPEVTFKGAALVKGTDYELTWNNCSSVGTASVVVTGKGDFTGSKTIEYRIGYDFTGADVSITKSSYSYTGSKICPEPSVEYDGRTLEKGTDYTVSYSNNINAGTATVTVKGIGKYTGTKKLTFTIKPLSITKVSLSATSFVYTGKYRYPKVTVYQGSNKIASAVTSGNSNIRLTMSLKKSLPGTYTIKFTGTGNYTGTLSRTYKIYVKPVSVTSLTAKSKGFTVKCTKLTSTYVTGYQVRYSTSSKMTSAKTVTIGTKSTSVTKTVSKLTAKKKYYVQVRSYKTVNGKKYYSSWSSSKSVTTKYN